MPCSFLRFSQSLVEARKAGTVGRARLAHACRGSSKTHIWLDYVVRHPLPADDSAIFGDVGHGTGLVEGTRSNRFESPGRTSFRGSIGYRYVIIRARGNDRDAAEPYDDDDDDSSPNAAAVCWSFPALHSIGHDGRLFLAVDSNGVLVRLVVLWSCRRIAVRVLLRGRVESQAWEETAK